MGKDINPFHKIRRKTMQAKTKMLQMSKKGQMGVGNLSGFTIVLLRGGILGVILSLIILSFSTTLTKNGEATTAVNTSISNMNSAFSTIASYLPLIALVVVAGIIITVVVLSLAFGGRREEGRD